MFNMKSGSDLLGDCRDTMFCEPFMTPCEYFVSLLFLVKA